VQESATPLGEPSPLVETATAAGLPDGLRRGADSTWTGAGLDEGALPAPDATRGPGWGVSSPTGAWWRPPS
jgi:hypothetical protein